MTNQNNTVFYIGVTSDLISRIIEHKEKVYPKCFTAKYNINKLVYFEKFYSIEEAIAREKEIKKYSRTKRSILIRSTNPSLDDLWDEVAHW